MHVIAAKAVAFSEAARPEFRKYQQAVVDNAKILSQELVNNGLRVVSGGTDNHLVLVDLSPISVTGQDAENALGLANITVNKNAIPFDPLPPRVTSGLRLGTPSITSRGFGTHEVKEIAQMIVEVLKNLNNQAVLKDVRDRVLDMTSGFPVPGLDG
jgi:glycine hydroxymethyltransferase